MTLLAESEKAPVCQSETLYVSTGLCIASQQHTLRPYCSTGHRVVPGIALHAPGDSGIRYVSTGQRIARA
eukprot:688341-Rhodomonas_salina.2